MSEEPTIHPIERIRDAFARAHAICVGSRAHYMSIPPAPERDVDLILTDAIDELERRRVADAELVAALQKEEHQCHLCDEWDHGYLRGIGRAIDIVKELGK